MSLNHPFCIRYLLWVKLGKKRLLMVKFLYFQCPFPIYFFLKSSKRIINVIMTKLELLIRI